MIYLQYDIKNQKIFLKKIVYPDISIEDLFIGNVIVCYNRQLKIVDFADEFTKKSLIGENTQTNRYFFGDMKNLRYDQT